MNHARRPSKRPLMKMEAAQSGPAISGISSGEKPNKNQEIAAQPKCINATSTQSTAQAGQDVFRLLKTGLETGQNTESASKPASKKIGNNTSNTTKNKIESTSLATAKAPAISA